MTEQKTSSPNEGQAVNPVQVARNSLNEILLGTASYDGRALERRVSGLQSALLGSGLMPEKTYHELSVVAGQGITRAEASGDADTATALREMKTGFESALENLRPDAPDAPPPAARKRATKATPTKSLPPMTGAKGK